MILRRLFDGKHKAGEILLQDDGQSTSMTHPCLRTKIGVKVES